MKFQFLAAILALALSFVACTKSEGDKNNQTEEPENTESVSQKGETQRDNEEDKSNDVNDLKDAAKQLQEALNNTGNSDAKEPVNFRQLKALFPKKVADLKLDDSSGETAGFAGFKISNANAEYSDGDKKRIDVSITDAAGIPSAMAGLASWTNIELDRDSDDGFERTTTYKGFKAFEKYDNKNKEGSIALIVADRFVVNVEGDGVSMDDIYKTVDAMPLNQLVAK